MLLARQNSLISAFVLWNIGFYLGDIKDCHDRGDKEKSRSLSGGIKAVNGVDDPNKSEEEPSIVKEEKGADIYRLFLVYFVP